MYTWIEYIAAAVISVVILLILFTIHGRNQDAATDEVLYRTSKESVVELIRLFEHDFNNMGSQHPASAASTSYPLPSATTFGIGSVPHTVDDTQIFEFYAQTARGQAPRTIRYEWAPEGSVTLNDGTTKDTYVLKRFDNGVLSGQSFDNITELNIQLLESPGNGITNIDKTRQVFIRLRAVSPFGKGDTVEETMWSTVVQPMALTIKH